MTTVMRFPPSRIHRTPNDQVQTTGLFSRRSGSHNPNSSQISASHHPAPSVNSFPQTLPNKSSGPLARTQDPRMILRHRRSKLDRILQQNSMLWDSNRLKVDSVVTILDRIIQQEDQLCKKTYGGKNETLELSPHQLVTHSHYLFPEELNPLAACQPADEAFRYVGYLEQIGFGYFIVDNKVTFWCAAARFRHLFGANEEASSSTTFPREDQNMPPTEYSQHFLDHYLSEIKLIDYPRTEVHSTSNSSVMLMFAYNKLYLYKYALSKDGRKITTLSPHHIFNLGGLEIVKAVSLKRSRNLRIFYMEADRDEVKEAGVSERTPFYAFRKRVETEIRLPEKNGWFKNAYETGRAVCSLILNKSIRAFSRQEKMIRNLIVDEENCLLFSHVEKFYSNDDVQDIITMYSYNNQTFKRQNSFTSDHLRPYLTQHINTKIMCIAPAQSRLCKYNNLIIKLEIGTILFIKVHPIDIEKPITQVSARIELNNPVLFREPRDSRWIDQVLFSNTNILQFDKTNDEFIELTKSYPLRNMQVATARWNSNDLGTLKGMYPLDPACLYSEEMNRSFGLQGGSSYPGQPLKLLSTMSTIQQVHLPPTTYVLIGSKGYCLVSRLRQKDEAFSEVFQKSYSSQILNNPSEAIKRIGPNCVEAVVSLLDIFLGQGPRYFFVPENTQLNQSTRGLAQSLRSGRPLCDPSQHLYYVDAANLTDEFCLSVDLTLIGLCNHYKVAASRFQDPLYKPTFDVQFINQKCKTLTGLISSKGLKVASLHIYIARLLRPIFSSTLSQIYACHSYYACRLESIQNTKLKGLFFTPDLHSPDIQGQDSLQAFLRRCLQLLELLASLTQEHSPDLLPKNLFSESLKSPSLLEEFFFRCAITSPREQLAEWKGRFPQFMSKEFVDELRMYYQLRKLQLKEIEEKLKNIDFSQTVTLRTILALRDLHPNSQYLNHLKNYPHTRLRKEEDNQRKYYRLLAEQEKAKNIKEKLGRLIEALDVLDELKREKPQMQTDYALKKQELKKLRTQVFIIQELQNAGISESQFSSFLKQVDQQIILEVAEKAMDYTSNSLVPLIAFLNLGRQGDNLAKIEKYTTMAVGRIPKQVSTEAYYQEVEKYLEVMSELIPKDAPQIQHNLDIFLQKFVPLVESLFRENEENRGGENTRTKRYNLCERLSEVFGTEIVLGVYQKLCRELSRNREAALLQKIYYEEVEPVLERLGEERTLKAGQFRDLLQVTNSYC